MSGAVIRLAGVAGLFAAVAVAYAQSPSAADETAGGWRGVVVPPYPSGVRELAGSCIGEGPGGDTMCAISIAVLKDEQSGVRTILATRRLHHADGSAVGGDRPLTLVTDAIEPRALDDARADVSIGLCQQDGKDDSRIVAIIQPDVGTEWYTRLSGAWRLDEAGRLAPIDGNGVRCLNEGYGYDG